MVLCFHEEFKLFYVIVPAPSNRQILGPSPNTHTFSLCIYWPRKKENLDHSWSPGPPDGSKIYLCVLTLAITPPWGERKSRKRVAVYMRKWRTSAKHVICCSCRKTIQSVSEFPEIYLSSNFTPGLNKWCVICDLLIRNVKSEEGFLLRTEIKQMCLRKREEFSLYHHEKA